jgi:meso-butanediol dehydrogenase/(S,S)-butanediol dehydrogenase/diacetyl reductase
MRLENKVALITGGGTGVGAAAARMFTREGAKVVVTGRRLEPIQAVAQEVGGVAVAGDTSDPAHAAEAVAAAVSTFGGLDVVVASAGIGITGTVGEMNDQDWQRQFDVNLTGPMMMTRAALPEMLKRGGGSVVLVASTNAQAAAPASVAYDASKAGLLALARGIAVDYGPQGIRANAVCPGWIITPMGDESMDELAADRGLASREDAYNFATGDIPLRRAGTADEMAACCLFLASDESSIVTGTTLIADGGGQAVELTSRMFSQTPGMNR